MFLDDESNNKKGVVSAYLMANISIIDPMLTITCPSDITASAGFDALLHAAETFVSKGANPLTDPLALQAISIIAKWIGPAYADGSNLDARYYMAMGSNIAGLPLNNSGTSLIHCLAYPVGSEYHFNHGKSLTPIVLACFDAIMVAKQDRFVQMAAALGEDVKGLAPRDGAQRCLDALKELMIRLDLPICLNDLGINDQSKVDQWAIDAHANRRLLSNCARDLSVDDIKKIYLASFSR